MIRKNKSVLSALLVMVLWGALFPLVKSGYAAYGIESTGDILLFAGVRFTICGAVICLYTAAFDRKSYRIEKSSVLPILLSGLFAIILHYSFTYIGLTLTESSKTAILKQVGALFYVCFSFVFFRQDRPTVRKILAALIGFLGIIAINLDSFGGGFAFGVGELLIILASFCTVASNVVGKKAMTKVAPVTMTGLSQVFGGVVLLGVGLALGGRVGFTLDKLYIFAAICVASILSYCIWFGIVKNAELSKLFIIKFTEPVFACLFGALILGEDVLKPQYLAAFLLISGGIWIVSKE